MEEHKINVLMKSAGANEDDIAAAMKAKENDWLCSFCFNEPPKLLHCLTCSV
jgi:hypothetical protein